MGLNVKYMAHKDFESEINQKSCSLIKKLLNSADGKTHFNIELKFTFNYSTAELLLFPKNLHHSHQNPEAWNLNLGHAFREGHFVFQRFREGVFKIYVRFSIGSMREDDLPMLKILKSFFEKCQESVNFLYPVNKN